MSDLKHFWITNAETGERVGSVSLEAGSDPDPEAMAQMGVVLVPDPEAAPSPFDLWLMAQAPHRVDGYLTPGK